MFPYHAENLPDRLDAPSGEEWNRVADACSRLGMSMPLHVLVSDSRDIRRANNQRVVHKYAAPHLSGSIGQIGRGLYVESPEMLFMSAAAKLAFAQLVQLGCGLCGSFALEENSVGGVVYREKVTTPARLEEFARKNSSMRGSVAASKALSLGCVIPNARSPKEITLMLLLCLPPRYGGYGLPWPSLNRRIDISQRSKEVVRHDYLVGDLVWENRGSKLIVEYDSKAVHEDRYDKDKSRMGDLNYMGYEVISVTARSLYSFKEMDRVAMRVAKALGVRLRKDRLELGPSRIELRKQLFENVPFSQLMCSDKNSQSPHEKTGGVS